MFITGFYKEGHLDFLERYFYCRSHSNITKLFSTQVRFLNLTTFSRGHSTNHFQVTDSCDLKTGTTGIRETSHTLEMNSKETVHTMPINILVHNYRRDW